MCRLRELVRGFGCDLYTAGRRQSKRFDGAKRGDKTIRSEKAACVSVFEMQVMVVGSLKLAQPSGGNS